MSIERRLQRLEEQLPPEPGRSWYAVTLLYDSEADVYREYQAPFRPFTAEQVAELRESGDVDVLTVRFVAAVDGRPA